MSRFLHRFFAVAVLPCVHKRLEFDLLLPCALGCDGNGEEESCADGERGEGDAVGPWKTGGGVYAIKEVLGGRYDAVKDRYVKFEDLSAGGGVEGAAGGREGEEMVC